MWENAVVTNVGKALLASWVDGTTLDIVGAKGGTGTVADAALMAQTGLVNEKQTLSILGSEPVSNGMRLRVQITAPGTGYTLNQIGIFAKVNDGPSTLLALYQDNTGISIPAASSIPDFVYTFYAIVEMSNTGTMTVNIDTSALVSLSQMNEALADKLNADGDGSDLTVAFSAAASRENIGTGEKLSVMFGKITKWFADLGAAAFKGVGTGENDVAAGNHSHSKADVGLGNVDNTSDANKPISTATQAALNAKAPLASPNFTGTPKAPTGTDYTTLRLRNISLYQDGTTIPTLGNGEIAFTYE